MKNALEILNEFPKTWVERRRVYGPSYVTHAHVMKALFPNGVTLNTPIDMLRYSILNMVLVKLVRYCRDFQKPHQDSMRDTGVYAAQLEEIDQFIGRDFSELEAMQPGIDQLVKELSRKNDGRNVTNAERYPG